MGRTLFALGRNGKVEISALSVQLRSGIKNSDLFL